MAILASMGLQAQRKITPVTPRPATSSPEPEVPVDPRANLAEMLDAQGNVVFVDTITGEEWVDSTIVKPKVGMIYPLYHAVTVGVNLWDPAMKLFGASYGGASVWGELSLHNRYKPYVELGVGMCDDTPDGMNYTYKSKMAPYFKIGASYNVFYNSNPDYQLTVGLRYGFSPFRYEVTDVTLNQDYWGDKASFNIPSQSASVGYFEVAAGVSVNVFKNIGLGWKVIYHSILHESSGAYGKPMYIPGYGKRGGSFTGSFSISYTIPLNNTPSQSVNTEEAVQ